MIFKRKQEIGVLVLQMRVYHVAMLSKLAEGYTANGEQG